MKRKLYFMAGLAALAMLFAACSNLGDVSDSSSSSSSSNATRNGSDQTLTISLTDASFDIARTVYPGDWTNGDKANLSTDLANNLVYVLTGYTVDKDTDVDKGSDSADFTDPETPNHKYVVLDYEDLMNGTAQVNLKPLVWYFTLTAYGTLEKDSTSGDVQNADLTENDYAALDDDDDGVVDNKQICLIGTIHADMTDGENKVTFNMLPPVYVIDEETELYKLTTTAIGKANYAVSFTPPDSFWYMKYAFYPEDGSTLDIPDYENASEDALTTDSTETYFVKTAGATDSDPITLVEATYAAGTSGGLPTLTAKTTDPTTYTTEASTVDGNALTYKMYTESGDSKTGIVNYLKAGKYWFRAEFYDTNNKRLLLHTEKFVIDGINTSADEVTLNYKTFTSAPRNIDELALQYTYNSVTFDEDPVSLYAAHPTRDTSSDTYPTTYTATLTWEDVADNEIGYQLWLRTYDGSAYTDDVFGPDDLVTGNDAKDVYGITTLAAGINTTQITLNTGVKYEIRLRAYNDRSVAQSASVSGSTVTYGDYGERWGTYALAAKAAGYDYFVPYIPRAAEYDETDATTLADADKTDINFGLFTIDYNLNGGSIRQTSAKTSKKLHYTIPYIYKESVNKLVDTSEFPYIDRSGYDFIGWNELYGNTGISIDGKVIVDEVSRELDSSKSSKKYYSHPNYGEDGFVATDVVTLPTGANVSLDSIVKNGTTALTKTEDIFYMNGTRSTSGTAEGSLATYTYTVTLDAEDTTGAYDGHVVSVVDTKYIYSNLLAAGGSIPADSCENRELYASWETPLSMSIKLPSYPSFKLTKIAAAGDPLEYSLSSDTTKNSLVLKASDKLSNLAFTIYYDDGAVDATEVFDNVIVNTAATTNVTTADDTDAKTRTTTVTDGADTNPATLATLVVPITVDSSTDPATTTVGTGGTFTWNYNGNTAGVYILKVSGTYTYGTSKTNSLAGQSDVVEGYIYIRLTN